MGICVRYFSKKRSLMVTDFLGLVQVTGVAGKELAAALKGFLELIDLPLKNLRAIGVDWAPNMCGHINSFYTHLKQDVPELLLFKCVFHSIDKCAEHAFDALPQNVPDVMNETNNWFAHSALRWDEYCQYYKTMHERKEPKKMIGLSQTRWLVWVAASENIFDQWYELQGFLTIKGTQKGHEKAVAIAKLYNSSNLLYIQFLRAVIKPVLKISKSFEQTDVNITKLYTDIRSTVLTLASRILKPQSMVERPHPGILRRDEVRVIEDALKGPKNLLPVDLINLGDAFIRTAQAEKVPAELLSTRRHKCGEYIFMLTKLLLQTLPDNLDGVSKLKLLTPRKALAKTARPTFKQLPIELAGPGFDVDDLESQWTELGTLVLTDIFDDLEENVKIEDIDIVQFWSNILDLTNSGGERVFEKLALFALSALTLPISNAVVERAYSVLSCIKCRRRNRLQLRMLEALMRLRIHLKVHGQCCKDFEPTKGMVKLFYSDMYQDPGHKAKLVSRAVEAGVNRHSDPDEPEEMVLYPQDPEPEELEEIDFQIASMIDAIKFDENLLLVHI